MEEKPQESPKPLSGIVTTNEMASSVAVLHSHPLMPFGSRSMTQSMLTRYEPIFLAQLSAAILLSAMTVGCGSSSQLKGLVPASGVFRFQGEPLEGVVVVLNPISVSTEFPRAAFGVTDASGHFVLRTLQPNDGAYPGEYAVTATKIVPAPWNPEVEGINILPPKYESPDTSGITATVGPKGTKDIVVELTK